MSEINRKRKHSGHTQSIILKYIQEQIEERGFPPSVREICEATGLKSTLHRAWPSETHGTRGAVAAGLHEARAMTLLQADKPQGKEERCASHPHHGASGRRQPILAEETMGETLPVPDDFLKKDGDYFALVVGARA